jgi:hypothetical protein
MEELDEDNYLCDFEVEREFIELVQCWDEECWHHSKERVLLPDNRVLLICMKHNRHVVRDKRWLRGS